MRHARVFVYNGRPDSLVQVTPAAALPAPVLPPVPERPCVLASLA